MLFLHWNANLLLRSEATVDLHWLLQSQFNSSDNQSLPAQELKMMHLKLKTEFFASPVAAVKVSEISRVLELIWCVTLASQFLFQVSQSKKGQACLWKEIQEWCLSDQTKYWKRKSLVMGKRLKMDPLLKWRSHDAGFTLFFHVSNSTFVHVSSI